MCPNNYGQLPAQALLGHTLPPCPPAPRRQMCREWWPPVQHNTHKHMSFTASLSPTRAWKWWAATQSSAALAIIAGVTSEAKRGQNFHHKKKQQHCYENVRFNTRNGISRSPSQFFYSCVVCCWFRGSFLLFFTQKVLVFSSPINMIAIPSQLRGEFNGTLEIVSQKFF